MAEEPQNIDELDGGDSLPEHFHTSDRIDWRHLAKKKVFVPHTIPGDDVVTSSNYGTFWIAPFDCAIIEVRQIHQSAFSSGTLNIEKLTGTTAPDSGVEVLASDFDLTGTANTVSTPALTSTVDDKRLKRGDRLAMKDGGTLVGGSHINVTIEVQINI
ncbi:MAG: hypothetical protein CMB99_15405 [Flavobacteriaceae bacterium]|jgi:hypothetical protein|nr:hypothetical protein [Flavobacteriaceae bacterium]|tara:strand:+ start:6187 stop:6660 length:474 start_codon:yes stop_codon:yes gene_type:complete